VRAPGSLRSSDADGWVRGEKGREKKRETGDLQHRTIYPI